VTVTAPAIHQFAATAEEGAVGSHMLGLQHLLRAEGRDSEIFAEHRRGRFADAARPHVDYGTAIAAAPGDIVVYHLAIGSVIADWLAPRPQALVVVHHNLTPVRFLRGWDPDASYGVEWGLRQLPELAARARLGVGVSSFNAADLIAAGFERTAVAPVLFDATSLRPQRASGTAREGDERRSPGASWLFVGRLAAHKCQHQIVRALAAYRRLYDPHATLRLVGGPQEGPYVDAVRSSAAALGVGGALSLTGPVSPERLAGEYRRADVLVCLSEHEGFCVPLVEAMTAEVPVVTVASSAIPETVADAAVVLPFARGRQPPALAVAAAVHRVLSDTALRAQLVGAGRRRAAALGPEVTGRRWMDLLGALPPGPPRR